MDKATVDEMFRDAVTRASDNCLKKIDNGLYATSVVNNDLVQIYKEAVTASISYTNELVYQILLELFAD